MEKKICLFIFIISLLIPCRGFSENDPAKSATISGFIKDATTGESLTGAVVYPKENPSIGISSNSYGYFSLTLPVGKYTMIIQFMGYKTKNIPIELNGNIKLNIEMEEESIAVKEITIVGEKNNINVIQNDLISKINIKEIQSIPVILGEKDILKTIQLLPGVTPAGEGNAGFYVRGWWCGSEPYIA